MPQGKVLAVTDKNGGRFKVGNDWYGLSYAAKKAGAADMPSKGDEVTFSVDTKGYVDSLTVQGTSSPVATAPQQAVAQSQAAGWVPPAGVKIAALKAAACVMSGVDDSIEHLTANTVLLAQGFERYLTGMGEPVTTSSPVLRQAASVVNNVPDLPF